MVDKIEEIEEHQKKEFHGEGGGSSDRTNFVNKDDNSISRNFILHVGAVFNDRNLRATGGRASVLERTIAVVAFNPPPCAYGDKSMKHIRTIDGEDICISLYAPFSAIDPQETCTVENYVGDQTCILYSHGNAEDINDIKAQTSWLADNLGCNIITWDPIGFGRSSQGTPTEKNMQQAIEAVYDYATQHLRVPEHRMILMGRSIGTAPTIHLASTAHCGASSMILISPLASGFRTMFNPKTVGERVCKLLDPIFCPSIERIKLVRVPVCIVHGRADGVIPIHNAEELCAAVPMRYQYPPLYINGADHNDIMSKHQQVFLMHLETFLAFCEKQRQAAEEYT